MVKSYPGFQAMGSLSGGEKSLKQYREPGGRSMEAGYFQASHHVAHVVAALAYRG